MIEDLALGPDDDEATPKERLRYVRDGLVDVGDILTDFDFNELDNYRAERAILTAERLVQRALRALLTALEAIG